MKNLMIVAITLISISSNFIMAQEGTYKNSANQILTVTNSDECCFDFKITGGVDDEWGCLFDADGKATYASSTAAYYGEDEEMSDINFIFVEGGIKIEGGMDFVGNDCARYGDSMDEKYTSFKLVK